MHAVYIFDETVLSTLEFVGDKIWLPYIRPSSISIDCYQKFIKYREGDLLQYSLYKLYVDHICMTPACQLIAQYSIQL